MRVLAFLIGLCSLLGNAALAQDSLTPAQITFLSGRWFAVDTRRAGITCAHPGDDEFEEYAFRFESASGSAFWSDGVDLSANGKVAQATSDGSKTKIVINWNPAQKRGNESLLIQRIDADHIALDDLSVWSPGKSSHEQLIYSRCGQHQF